MPRQAEGDGSKSREQEVLRASLRRCGWQRDSATNMHELCPACSGRLARPTKLGGRLTFVTRGGRGATLLARALPTPRPITSVEKHLRAHAGMLRCAKLDKLSDSEQQPHAPRNVPFGSRTPEHPPNTRRDTLLLQLRQLRKQVQKLLNRRQQLWKLPELLPQPIATTLKLIQQLLQLLQQLLDIFQQVLKQLSSCEGNFRSS